MHLVSDQLLVPQVPDPLAGPVATTSLVNAIVERFRVSIINGSLKPGDGINESQLAERLGVARGTLREAIRILISEGLLEKLPNRTSRVRWLSPEKAWEIMTARAIIEGFAAGVLAQRLTREKVDALYALWEQMYEAARAGDRAAFLNADFALHQAIMQMSGHELLLETWTRLSAWVRLMFAAEQHTAAELLANAANHRRFVEAIASGDPVRAEAELKTDLMDQQELWRFAGDPAAPE